MWHEARRQEKKIRGLMVDYKRRAERRREFYEKIKLDPAQFVRVFGQACKINLDPAIAIAAESPQSMMPWQGDTSNMIDRFDVRAHLDILPPEKTYAVELSREEQDEERKANYERYRIIVENECAGLTEEQALQQLYFDELYGAINKDGEEEKSKLKDKKAAIGYTYEDSTKPDDDDDDDDDDDSDESDKEDIETLDLDIALDIDSLTPDQMEQLNICGTQFGMGKDDFIRSLRNDKDESEALRLAKLLEEEKAQFAGRKSRRERRIYKEKRLAGRKLSPPSYAARDSPKYEPYRRSSSRSRSRSRTPPRKAKKMYITSFGENDDSDDGIGVMQGPELPPGLGTNKDWEKKTEPSCAFKRSKRSRSNSSEKFSNKGRRRSRSRDRKRRSRSRGYRSRSGERRSRNGRDYRSRSRSRGRRSRDRHSSERSRRSNERYRSQRSRSNSRRSQRSRSNSRRSRSHDRHSSSQKHNRSKSDSRSKSRSRSRRSSRSTNSSSRSRSRSSSRSSRSESKSPVKPVLKSYRRESLSSKSDSDSDTDDKYKPSSSSRYSKPSTSKVGLSKPSVVFGKSTNSTQKLTPQERLKKRMQLALSKQYKADKKAAIIKKEKIEQEKMDREEEIRIRALEMRRKEREKRHLDLEDVSSDEDNDSRGSSPSRYRREKSPPPTKKSHEAESRKKKRSHSRSRSRSPEKRRPTSYR